MPISSSSNGSSSFHNNEMEGEVVGSRPNECMYTLPIKTTSRNKNDSILSLVLYLSKNKRKE
jgi:hypothetical protein